MGNKYKDYDELVTRYGFDKSICPSVSKHWGSQLPSDMLFDMWTMFFVRRTANNHFDVSFNDMRMWGPKECLDFYSERLVSSDGKIRESYSMDNRDSNIRKHIGGQSDEFFEVFTYRWNNGYAFTDYNERIQIALGRHAAAKGKDCAAEIAKIESIIKEKNALAAGIKELSQNPDISARLSAMLQNMDVSISDVMGDED